MEETGVLSSLLLCHCLGERCFGQDIDDLFAYQTPRITKIKDRTLGLTKLVLLLVVFAYVVVWQMAYNGSHFKVEDIEGVSRLQWQQPTMHWCNPMHVNCFSNITDISSLSYCKQYNGDKSRDVGQRPCAYKDAWELPINLPSGVLMPTRLNIFHQKRMCEHNAPECESKFRFQESGGPDAPLQTGTGDAEPYEDIFVADVEDFTVLIDHSFSSASGGIAFDDYAMQGSWLDCSGKDNQCVKRPIKCVHDKCGEMGLDLLQQATVESQPPAPSKRLLRKGKAAPEVLGLAQEKSSEAELYAAGLEAGTRKFQVISLKDGDVMSIKTMLAMANHGSHRAPPPGGYKLEDIINSDGESRRMRGGALVLRINYDNSDHWRIFQPRNPPTYTISVTMRPAEEFKHLYVSENGPDAREVIKAYGFLIVVQQMGRICTFDVMHALIVIVTAMALLGVSNALTDMLALYVLPRRNEYTKWKYFESDDMVTVGSGTKDGTSATAS